MGGITVGASTLILNDSLALDSYVSLYQATVILFSDGRLTSNWMDAGVVYDVGAYGDYILLGDLDWIVIKALEKDRTRRYESASDFAADIQRYTTSEPVIARPPSVNCRLRKFTRKNRIDPAAPGTDKRP